MQYPYLPPDRRCVPRGQEHQLVVEWCLMDIPDDEWESVKHLELSELIELYGDKEDATA